MLMLLSKGQKGLGGPVSRNTYTHSTGKEDTPSNKNVRSLDQYFRRANLTCLMVCLLEGRVKLLLDLSMTRAGYHIPRPVFDLFNALMLPTPPAP